MAGMKRRRFTIGLGVLLGASAVGCGEDFENPGPAPEIVADVSAGSLAAANGAVFITTLAGPYAVVGLGDLLPALPYPNAYDVARGSDGIYWLVELEDTPFVVRQPFDAGPAADVPVGLTAAMQPRDLAIDEGGRLAVVYQPENASDLTSGIRWFDVTTEITTAPDANTFIKGVAVGADRVYVCAFEGDVRRYSDEGWVPINIPEGICNAIVADEDYVYWLEEGPRLRVMRAAHQDPVPVELASLGEGLSIANGHLAQDETSLFFAAIEAVGDQRPHDAVVSVSKGGGAPRVLTSRPTIFMTGPMAVDLNYVYFGAVGAVMRVPK